MNIQSLTSVSAAQYELLLSADPSPVMVASYVNRALKFAAQIDHKLVGVLLLLPTHPQTIWENKLILKDLIRLQKTLQ